LHRPHPVHAGWRSCDCHADHHGQLEPRRRQPADRSLSGTGTIQANNDAVSDGFDQRQPVNNNVTVRSNDAPVNTGTITINPGTTVVTNGGATATVALNAAGCVGVDNVTATATTNAARAASRRGTYTVTYTLHIGSATSVATATLTSPEGAETGEQHRTVVVRLPAATTRSKSGKGRGKSVIPHRRPNAPALTVRPDHGDSECPLLGQGAAFIATNLGCGGEAGLHEVLSPTTRTRRRGDL
jgi:hypothetical protein